MDLRKWDPLSELGMWFTGFLIVISFGIFVYAVTTLTRYMIDGVITTLPVDADNLFVVLTAKEINPEMTIISRASNENSDIKPKRAGATNVIMPNRVGGQSMAKLVTQPDREFGLRNQTAHT